MNPIRVLLVDDHDLVRAGLRTLLEQIPGFEVIDEAANGREALHQIEALAPNIVLMDLMMPELNGLDATARSVSQFPNTRIIILSMNSGEEFVIPALQAGATGYLLKNIDAIELERAIRTVAHGETYLCSMIPNRVIEACLSSNSGPINSLQQLTQRQREVLQLIAEGNTIKLIAGKLGISAKTVETHRHDLMKFLCINDVAGLTRYAIRMGLITPGN